MILTYVWRNFRRRRVRTVLMVVSLAVSIGLIAALSATIETLRQSNVELIVTQVGDFDLVVRRTDISPDPFLDVNSTADLVRGAHPAVTAVAPRFEVLGEVRRGGETVDGWLLGVEPAGAAGKITVVSGAFALDADTIVLLEETAGVLDAGVGDSVEVAYSLPQPREPGQPGAAGASQRLAVRSFTVGGVVRQQGLTGAGVRAGVLVDLAVMQQWLGLNGRAERLVVVVDPALYETRDAEAAALRVRAVAEAVAAQLDDTYAFALDKAVVLDSVAEFFLITQALVNVYGLTALGIVGLLVHTLVMTNVQEQQRDMAILRILGSRRGYLFALVLVEVFVLGAIGVVIGIFLGQLVTRYAVVPIIASQVAAGGATTTIEPQITLGSMLPVVLSAIVVLFFSGLRPAQRAARTKVMHAINPGVADNLQIEDLAQLRERQPSIRLFFLGLVMIWLFVMLLGLDLINSLGFPALEAGIIFGAVIFMVLGIGFVFFITTVPFERLILLLGSVIAARFTYFARRNVSRGQTRNTLISLLVLFSGILPTFLASGTALERANLESDVRLTMGAPVDLRFFGGDGDDEQAVLSRLRPSEVGDGIAQVPGVGKALGLTYPYRTAAADVVGLRRAQVSAIGIDGVLDELLFQDLIVFAGGDRGAFATLLAEPGTAVISEGLAGHLALALGDELRLDGQGLDHEERLRIVGIARRVPGFDNIGRNRNRAASESDVLLSLATFQRLSNDPRVPPPAGDAPLITRVLATTEPGSDPYMVADDLRRAYGRRYALWVRLLDVEIEQARQSAVETQIVLLVLTGLSFITAVFGVFAVIYVTIYARRLEIGMLKAIGMQDWELTGTLIVESITMTLSAALAGITAGTAMGILLFVGERLGAERPLTLAVDPVVGPFIVIMVVLASMLSATFAARRILRRRAVEILRMM